MDEVRAAVSNLIDNAVKYSGLSVKVSVEIAATDEKHRRRARARSGSGHSEDRAEGNLQALLSGSRTRCAARARHGSGAVHRPLGRQAARRPSLGGKRRSGTRQHVCLAASHRPNEQGSGRRRRAAPGRRACASIWKRKAIRSRWWTPGKPRSKRSQSDPTAFDVVVLDVMLPGKDGFSVMSEMRGAGPIRADPDADGARPSGRRSERLRRGRGRLPHQALRSGDPDCPHSRPAAPPRMAYAVVETRPSDASHRPGRLYIRRQVGGFRSSGTACPGPDLSADADGSECPALL